MLGSIPVLGIFFEGIFFEGIFFEGIFYKGTLHKGTFYAGIFYTGMFYSAPCSGLGGEPRPKKAKGRDTLERANS